YPRERCLSAEEIRIFWHGLDSPDMPWDRNTRLALKFALVTMLRSQELRCARRDELMWNGDHSMLLVPLKRVKRRREIQQPLSDLAIEIIREAMESDDQEFIFAGRWDDAPIARSAMATALRGTRKTPGICKLLGLKPFTPHDLRRTAATLAGDLRLPHD